MTDKNEETITIYYDYNNKRKKLFCNYVGLR